MRSVEPAGSSIDTPSEISHQTAELDQPAPIYDLLMSGRQRVTPAVLRGLARERGIFYSARSSRDWLIESISGLLHDHYDILRVMDKRESSARAEKTTSITLDATLTPAEIKAAVSEYRQEAKGAESITTSAQGANVVNINLEYDEFDYSKTRLLQKQTKEAEFSFVVKDGKTTVRMPATDKGREVVRNLQKKIEVKRDVAIPAEAIELTEFSDPDIRTRFFLSLFSKMEMFKQITVTSLKVASGTKDGEQQESLELEDGAEDQEEAEQMLSVVRNVALNGQNLVASSEYKQLRNRGFFITHMVWEAARTEQPYDHAQFTAGFEIPHEGKNFRYLVRISPKLGSGEHAKNYRMPTENEKTALFDLIEKTARRILEELRTEASEKAKKQSEAG